MNLSEFLVAGMSTFLDEQPEALAAYTAYRKLSDDRVLWERIKARERFLKDQWLDHAEAYTEAYDTGRTEVKIETARNLKRLGVPVATIAKGTGLSLPEVEQLN